MEEDIELQLLETNDALEKDDDLDIYTEEGIDNYIDDDSITPTEQGFMVGYLNA